MATVAGLSYLAYEHFTKAENDLNIPSSETTLDPEWNLPNEVFLIKTNEETVVETEYGTVTAIPQDAFVDENDNPVSGQVDFKVTEAMNPLDIMKAGLSTTSDGKLLETGGMFNLTASQDGKELKLNPNKPLLFNVPTNDKKEDMMVFDGEKKEDSSINWTNPQPMDNYLTTVDIHSLNFYPPEYEAKLKELGYQNATKEFKDSLFYSFYCMETQESDHVEEHSKTVKHPILGIVKTIQYESHNEEGSHGHDEATPRSCGIEPSQIKTIWNDKFQNTLLATKEFEERLFYLYALCDNNLLQQYISGLDKNLYEIDQQIAQQASGFLKTKFEEFAKQKKGKVKLDSPTLKALNRYYKKKSQANHIATQKAYESYWQKQQ